MITTPMDVLDQFPIRKSKKQKQTFRESVQVLAEAMGYAVAIEKGSFGANNMVIGDPASAKYLVTAHYDTCARMPIPNFITPCNFAVFFAYQLILTAFMILIPAVPGVLVGWVADSFEAGYFTWYALFWAVLILMMFGPANKRNANDNTSGVVTLLEIMVSLPENQRGNVCFVLFDLEEAGLIGSASYRKAHKTQTDKQIVLNLDCVGDGDDIVMFPTARLKKDENKLAALDKISCDCGEKRLCLHKKGFAFCPSDQANFPYGVGIMAFRRAKGIGIYCSRIHTNRDTVLEQTNVNILRAALTTLICQ